MLEPFRQNDQSRDCHADAVVCIPVEMSEEYEEYMNLETMETLSEANEAETEYKRN